MKCWLFSYKNILRTDITLNKMLLSMLLEEEKNVIMLVFISNVENMYENISARINCFRLSKVQVLVSVTQTTICKLG